MSDLFNGDLKEQVEKFKEGIPPILSDKLYFGLIKVDHKNMTVQMDYRYSGQPWEDRAHFWIQKEVEMAMRDYYNKFNKDLFANSFEFILPLTDEVHEFRLRKGIH